MTMVGFVIDAFHYGLLLILLLAGVVGVCRYFTRDRRARKILEDDSQLFIPMDERANVKRYMLKMGMIEPDEKKERRTDRERIEAVKQTVGVIGILMACATIGYIIDWELNYALISGILTTLALLAYKSI